MIITETIRKVGYCMIDGRKVPLAETSPQRKKELQISLTEAFIALGHSPAAAKVAARGQRGNDVLDVFGLVEAASMSDPLSELGTTSKEFQATQKVLEGAGYTCSSVLRRERIACFNKDGARAVLVTMDGGWSFDAAKDDSLRGIQDPFGMKGNDSVMQGRNANQLKLAFLAGFR